MGKFLVKVSFLLIIIYGYTKVNSTGRSVVLLPLKWSFAVLLYFKFVIYCSFSFNSFVYDIWIYTYNFV